MISLIYFIFCFVPFKLLAMNACFLLLLLQLMCYFTETNTSAKPHNGTKDGKEPQNSRSTTKKSYDKTRTSLIKKQKWLQPSGNNFLKRVRKITKQHTTSTQCKIFCRSGYHLQILPNGVVTGTVDQGSKYGKYSVPSEVIDYSNLSLLCFYWVFRLIKDTLRLFLFKLLEINPKLLC